MLEFIWKTSETIHSSNCFFGIRNRSGGHGDRKFFDSFPGCRQRPKSDTHDRRFEKAKTLNPVWISFAFGFVLAALDLWGLSTLTGALGKKQEGWLKMLLLAFVMGHFGILAAAIWWISRQSYFNAPALAAGLFIPFAGIVGGKSLAAPGFHPSPADEHLERLR